MKDWKGWEPVFTEGRLSIQELLDLTECHFTYAEIPDPQLWNPYLRWVADLDEKRRVLEVGLRLNLTGITDGGER